MSSNYSLTSYTSFDLFAWYEQGELELSPKFQRRPVWSIAARSYFLDSLLSGYPVPPIHIRLVGQESRVGRREIIDGQQRLRTLFDFMGGRFRISRALDSKWSGMAFDELDVRAREELLYYGFVTYQYQMLDDASVLEMFARLNTYSVSLTRQELRNGKYFGQFKTAVYDAAYKHIEFWRSNRIVTEAGIARMAEAEITGELFALMLDGIQDKKSSLDEFYGNLDSEWGRLRQSWSSKRDRERPLIWLDRQQTVERFDRTLNEIFETVGELLPRSAFRRPALFYSLFGVVYHRLYGLPGFERLASPNKKMGPNAARRLWGAMEELSQLLAEKPPMEVVPARDRDFLIAAAGQTDNIKPRSIRFEEIWSRAGLSEG
ncbi:DUF262 domain-containing protein [Sanguibacter suarezii]|uniref:DUF262 domain-containing protein n=1 Tax=Sanguibacter suarezii TaxID=60921 RepID=UPI000A05250A|nr:DUF262 domain-containing protein [Sanguibacter suarezii]